MFDLEKESILLQDDSDLTHLNFLGLTNCPMRETFKESLEEVVTGYKEETGKTLRAHIPSGCSCKADLANIWKTENVDEFPDVFTSVGYNELFFDEFKNRFLNKGYFKAFQNENINKDFEGAGCIDPEGIFAMYCVSPTILLIDKKQLGDLPVPKTWSDLLNPIYKDKIIISGSEDSIFETDLLYIYKEHGEEGLIKLAHNIKDAWHPSKMSKTAGTNSKLGAAIYATSWFFAKVCPRTDETFILWPEDGALIHPLCMTSKVSKHEEVKVFTDYITGAEFGKRCAGNSYASLNPEVDNKLPEGAKFKWLGWDFLRNNNMEKLIKETNDLFIKEWKGRSK